MHSILIWPALTVLAGSVISVPAVADAGRRSILYWVVLPSLAVGAAAVCATVSH